MQQLLWSAGWLHRPAGAVGLSEAGHAGDCRRFRQPNKQNKCAKHDVLVCWTKKSLSLTRICSSNQPFTPCTVAFFFKNKLFTSGLRFHLLHCRAMCLGSMVCCMRWRMKTRSHACSCSIRRWHSAASCDQSWQHTRAPSPSCGPAM